MIGLVYIILAVILGDCLSSIFFRFKRWPERLASAFLVGLLISTWITYLFAAAIAWPFNPLIAGNLAFVLIAGAAIFLLRSVASKGRRLSPESTDDREKIWDWVTLGLCGVLITWLMFASFGFEGDKMRISYLLRSDMGSYLSIGQSFALGSNFPTEYPLFSGQSIRLHFLFWFQTGNLNYLGLGPIWSVNLLSIASMLSIMAMLIALGEALFGKRSVGRVAAALFFFHGSLAYLRTLWNSSSVVDGLWAFLSTKEYLNSGFGYHGENWGLWTMNVYVNQRHLIAAIGILALVLLSFVRFQRERAEAKSEGAVDIEDGTTNTSGRVESLLLSKNAEFVFCGVLIGLLPLWNGAVFISACVILGILFLLCSRRFSQFLLLITAFIVALPQLLFLRPETVNPQEVYPAFFWGFNVVPPTALNVLSYLSFTFGFKLLLVAIALVLLRRFDRVLFLAFSGLLVVTFCIKFSFEVLTNHKFMNIWIIFVNLFVAYGFYRLWKSSIAGKVAAVALALLIIPGGIVDMIPLRNVPQIVTSFDKEPLVVWIDENTPKDSIFLTEHYSDHPLLFSGRRIFQGYTYFTAAAGYPADARGSIYNEMFTSRNPARLLSLLNEHGIDYVVFDDSLRNQHLKGKGNEAVYAEYFQMVYAPENPNYENMKIYKVSEQLKPVDLAAQPQVEETDVKKPGLLGPRGIAVDSAGNYYVADTGNGLIQRFSPDGKFLNAFGRRGSGEGELKEPNGIHVADDGTLFVTDAANNKIVRFNGDGTFLKQWLGPDGGFYGPRDIASAPNGQLYIVDQGRLRVVRFDPKSEAFTLSWGSAGRGDGQFSEPTGITVAVNQVFVMDTGNDRIQVFDLDGRFIRQWPVPEWAGHSYRYPDAVFDERSKRLFVTSSGMNDLLAFDLEGKKLEGVTPGETQKLDNPSGIVLDAKRSQRRLLVLSTKGATVSTFELESDTKKR